MNLPRLLIRASFLIAAIAIAWHSPASLANASEEIVTFASIIAAGAVSSLIFSASIYSARDNSRAPLPLEDRFWGHQYDFWLVLFVSSIVTSLAVIIGEIVSWSAIVRFGPSEDEISFDFARLIAFVVVASLGITVSLMLDFARAIKDIIRMASRYETPNPLAATPSELDPATIAQGGTILKGDENG